MMPKSEVFNCDCIEFMRSLPDGHFDIAVCDPPFGAGNSEVFMDNGKRRFYRTGRFGKYHENVNTPPANSKVGTDLKAGGVSVITTPPPASRTKRKKAKREQISANEQAESG